MRLVLVHTGQRSLPEASPHDKSGGIDLSACDPESTNASTSGNKIANISSREATFHHSHKKKYALPLDTFADTASPKPALMIICGAPA